MPSTIFIPTSSHEGSWRACYCRCQCQEGRIPLGTSPFLIPVEASVSTLCIDCGKVSGGVFTCVGIPQPFLPGVDCSFRTRASCAPRQQRRPRFSWTPPLPHAAAASGTATRTITATPTCSSPCTSTSTAWRRVARAEVSCPLAPLCLLQACLETGPSNYLLWW